MGLMLAGTAQAPVMAKSHTTTAKGRAIEMRADRVVLYPQRMELKGDETLGDVLAMYPDLMQSGFADMLSGYNVRIDNVAINGDMRIVCRQLKANMINTIQICDNTAVAKGTTGLNRVIDITLRRGNQGGNAQGRNSQKQGKNAPGSQVLSGLAGVEAGTDNLADIHAVVRYDAPKTDVIAISSYSYQDIDDYIRQKQHLFAHMTNYFSPHDRLLTYVSQSYQNDRIYSGNNKEKRQNEKLLARARYFHKFNDKGTELLLVGSYQYGYIPYTLDPDVNSDPLHSTKNDATLFIVELNTPLTQKLSMMAGWEGDFSYSRYTGDRLVGGSIDRARNKYTASNNDLYLQFNYLTGIWRFTVGDRVMFYHYSTKGNTADSYAHHQDMKHNDTRNNIEASVIASITGHSQIQAAYHRKFINPSYAVEKPLSYENWLDIKQGLVAKNIDETKLGYTYTQSNFNLSLAAYYQMIEHDNNRCKLSASAFYRTGILALTAGANLYTEKGDGNDYATFHLNPRFSLPWQMALNIQSVFTAGNLKLLDDQHVYLSGQLTKQLGKHWNGAIEWHDICSKHYSAAMATVQYLF